MTYTITLQDFPEIPEDTRVKAEEQYRRALEKALGGPDEVPSGHRPIHKEWMQCKQT